MMLPTAFVLAGGLGTRLTGAFPDTAKCLVPVAGRPFLGWIMDYLAVEGIEHMHLCLGHQAEQVLEYLSVQAAPIRVTVSREHEPLGTAGALRHAIPPQAHDILAMYGDSYTGVPLRNFWSRYLDSGQDGQMAVILAGATGVAANVSLTGARVRHYSKTDSASHTHVDHGVLALSAQVLREDDASDLSSCLSRLATQGGLGAFEMPADRPFAEIGTPEAWAATCARFAGGTLPSPPS